MKKDFTDYFLHFKLKALAIVLIVLCLFPRMSSMAQNLNCLTLKQETDNQTHVTHEACKKIVLGTGYRFSSKSGKSMHAYIDPALVCDVHYGNQDGTSGETGGDPPFGNTFEVGTTAGEFAVSPTGGATYTIPLIVPPGTMGMIPHLSVSYNSQAGDGLLGIGWNLSGLSAISRTTQTLYHDENISPVSLTNADRFVLDGARLIATGTNDAGGSTYGTEAESFVRVNSIGQQGDGPNHFIVETKDGSTLEYGNSDDSRIEASGSNTALTWLLNKVTDVHGNYMKIYYTEDNGNGEFRPDYIEYTGNDKASPVLAPYNKVKFIYSERKDKQLAYVAGSQVKQSVLLTEVHTYDATGYQAHEYDFNYTYDMGSHLSAVVERGTDGKQYNSTKVDWLTISKPTATISKDDEMGIVSLDDTPFVPYAGDFNGDGFSDFFVILIPTAANPNTTAWYLYLNDGNGSCKNLTAHGSLPNGFQNISGLNDESRYEAIVDCNGDGKDDIILQGKDYNGVPFFIPFSCTNNNTLDHTFASPYNGAFFPNQGDQKKYFHLLGDFDGDGTTDIFVHFFLKHNYYIWSFSKGVFLAQGDNMDNGNERLRYQTVNFDGDAKDEIMFTYLNFDNKIDGLMDYNVIIGLVSGSLSTMSYGAFPNSCEGDNIYTGDFNGDGKTDLLTYNNCNKAWLIGNSVTSSRPGTSIQYHATPATFIPNNGNPQDIKKTYQYFVADFNGDGKSDIATIDFKSHVLTVYLSIGNNIFTPININTESYVFWNTDKILIGDYNGDGHADLIRNKQFGSYPIYGGLGNPILGFSLFPDDNNLNKVTSITNGLNSSLLINYNTLPKLAPIGSYTKGSSVTYPVMTIQKPFSVATNVLTDNGYGGRNSVSYKYEGAQIHLQGKGFLGFSTMTTVNDDRGIKVKNTYSFDNGFFDPLLKESQSTIVVDGTIKNISDKKYEFTTTNISSGSKIHYNYLNQLEDNDQLHNNVTTYKYYQDEYGNTYKQTSNALNLNTSNIDLSTSTIVNTPFIQAGAWIPTHPEKITTTTQRGNNPYTRFTDFTYNELGQAATIKTDAGVLTDMSTSDSYDKFGNLLKSTISVPGSTDIPGSTTTNGYDPKGRFVIRQSNALGHVARVTYDDAYGNVLKKIDPNQLTTQYVYDGFGRLKQTVTPTNQQINISRNWENPQVPTDPLFKVETTEAGMPTLTEHFDFLGRSLQTQTTGFDGTKINIDKIYNIGGLLTYESEPYYTGNENTILYNRYTYDALQRIEELNSASGTKVKYSYPNNSVKTVTTTSLDSRTVTKTLDASGLLTTVTDEGGTLNYTYHSCGKPLTITIPGTNKKVQMDYDPFGNQKSLNDPDAGLVTYTYDALGQLISQTDALNNTYTMTYDELGRLKTKTGTEGIITYNYGNKLPEIGMLKSVTGFNGINCDYTYDALSRLKTKKETIDGFDYTTAYQYDNLNHLTNLTYPSGFAISNEYNSYGYLKKVNKGSNAIWECTGMTERMQVLNATVGNGFNTQKKYTDLGYLKNSKLIQNSILINNSDYTFEPGNGNLMYRANNNLNENFTYDNLDRLTNGLDYFDNGNIKAKTDAGILFNYNGSHPHEISGIENPTTNISSVEQNVSYTPFLMPASIIEAPYEVDYTYGPDYARKKSVLKDLVNPTTLQTVIYSGDYEKISVGNNIYEVHYINSTDRLIAIDVRKNGGADQLYYVNTDHLGSITHIYDDTGNKFYEQNFDAWGRTRNPDWTYTSSTNPNPFEKPAWLIRGFTGHEYLPQFGLINMNARLYDPILGRVLSPDNFVQTPDNTQTYNRYSYCFNNPLKFIDPDGEMPWQIPVAILGVAGFEFGGASASHWKEWNPVKWDDQEMKQAVIGGLIGGGFGVGITAGAAKLDIGDISGIAISSSGYTGPNSFSAAPSAAWYIFSNAFITSNISMATTILQHGNLNEVFQSGVIGFGAGAAGATAGYLVKYGTLSDPGFGGSKFRSQGKFSTKSNYTQNIITTAIVGMGKGYNQARNPHSGTGVTSWGWKSGGWGGALVGLVEYGYMSALGGGGALSPYANNAISTLFISLIIGK